MNLLIIPEFLKRYLCFTVLIMILKIINSNDKNIPLMASIKLVIPTGLVK